jgi:hypothetical protein
MSNPYEVPLEQVERAVHVPRAEQVVLRGDGMGPPPVPSLGHGDEDADGDSD